MIPDDFVFAHEIRNTGREATLERKIEFSVINMKFGVSSGRIFKGAVYLFIYF